MQHLKILIGCLHFHSKMFIMIPLKIYFYKHYMSLEEIKDFNALIDNKQLFDQLVKNNQEVCEKLIEMLRNDDYTT